MNNPSDFITVKTALISVHDKEGIAEFAKELQNQKIEIIASSGTAKLLAKEKIKVTELDSVTGFSELLDGRVKTLSPKIHAGILVDRSNPKHLKQLKENKINAIDLVVVNLYPFKETIEQKNVSEKEVIENIDIGGVALIRAAGKNYSNCAIVVDKKDYPKLLEELNKNKNKISKEFSFYLMQKAFAYTAQYDSLIANYFSKELLPEKMNLTFNKQFDLRYGENPHQKAAFYSELLPAEDSLPKIEILHGKELSFNNIYDAESAIRIVQEFEMPCVVIIKHTNPCGVACDEKLSSAFKKAFDCDQKSAFGGVIALNRECDLETAKQIAAFFNEIVIAPVYSADALEELKKNKNRRIVILKNLNNKKENLKKYLDLKRVKSGLLVQEADNFAENENDYKIVTKEKLSKEQLQDLLFAWKVCKHVKSNAIVIAKNLATVGIGAGQTSRIGSVEIAIKKAGENVKNAVLASDAFFPFRDSVDNAHKAGISAIIQTGGSIKDAEVMQAADEHKMPMILTGIRHFKH
ncbi:MAG: bifunctional phosphoribosylaminoimidazolecarboxamide formyltransferase/inosine monophosphate cyclohydrolase [Candidatus Diapherotrites archaeon CG08_land_8_20_14_0_20_34_12]|nr:MAG: bifunctional phosphoribosylaminoimidazolecarboxamide formyltransferase/inosine monophosphate cyclohydrolase [Candidatus Diapherotrites archaeon CG08_land_8_20_14_0_20_34_12]